LAEENVLSEEKWLYHTQRPFFHILSDDGTVKMFLDAVKQNMEDARCFISKNCANAIDLFELRDSFKSSGYKCLFPVERASKNYRTDTVLLFNHQEKSIVRFYMIREPDRFGQWKIVSMERE
jgi:hypothetical protein